jgi:AICAR transformylase/IMP cyclohydrolase PurH
MPAPKAGETRHCAIVTYLLTYAEEGRVESARLGATKARELEHALEGTVVASGAFFRFPEGVEEAARAMHMEDIRYA